MITGMPRIAIATTNFDQLVAVCRQPLSLPVIDLTDDYLETLGARLAADDRQVVEITPASPFGALIRIEPATRRGGL